MFAYWPILRRALLAIGLAIIALVVIDIVSWAIFPCAGQQVGERRTNNYHQEESRYDRCPFNGGIVTAGLKLASSWGADAWTAFATLMLASFTGILAVATFSSVGLTRKSIALARAEFIATHRPRLRVYGFQSERDPPHGTCLSALFRLQNIGESRAYIRKIEGTISLQRDFPLEPGMAFTFAMDTDMLLQSGESEQFGIENGPLVTEENATAIYAGYVYVVCIGRITYLDDNQVERHIGFGRTLRFRPRFLAQTINDPEYEYAY